MNFNEFTEEIKGGIKLFLPRDYEDAQIDLSEVTKLNQKYLGLSIRKEDQSIAATFNMEALFDVYQEDPDMRMEDIMRHMTEIVLDTPEQFDVGNVMEYEKVKENLFIRVSSAERNKEMLEDIPHQKVEDLVLTYHIAVEKDEEGMAATTISYGMLKNYGISQEQLHQDAMKSSPIIMPVQIALMGDIMGAILLGDGDAAIKAAPQENIVEMITERVEAGDPMVIVTNQQLLNGASAIFYPNVMDKIGEGFRDNFFILPSSIHETLVVPDNGSFDYLILKDMVETVNAAEVMPSDKLSDQVYHYDVHDRVFERADKFAERMRNKAVQKNHDEKAGKPQQIEKPKQRKSEMTL